MSHTTTLKSLAIRDVSAIRAAVVDLKRMGVDCDLLQNAKPRMFYADQHGACDFVLKLNKGKYDVGFEKQTDGTFSPVFDEWADHISKQLAPSCPLPSTPEGKAQHQIGKFVQMYAKHAATNAAIAQGYMVESATVDKNGAVQLVVAGM